MNGGDKVKTTKKRTGRLPGWAGFLIAFLGWFVLGIGYCYLYIYQDFPEYAIHFYGALTMTAIVLLFVFKKWGFASGLVAALLVNLLLAFWMDFNLNNLENLLRVASIPIPVFFVVYLLLGGAIQ